MKANVSPKGRVTLPKAIRNALRIQSGTRLHFQLQDGGEVVIRRAEDDPLAISGMFHQPGRKPVTLEEMDQAISDALVERVERSRRG